MKWLVASAAMLLLVSCTKPSQLMKDTPGVMILVPSKAGVDSADEVSWAVGPDLRQKVSKGIRISVRFPVVSEEDMRLILGKTHADAWLIKITKKNLEGTRTLGILEFPLFPPGQEQSADVDLSRVSSTATFSVFYADASPSVRFEKFNCPAFGTHKIIDNVRIVEQDNRGRDHITIAATEEERVGEKTTEFNYYSTVFNAGMEMTGEYVMELAFYNRPERRRMSSWLMLNEAVEVSGETDKAIQGCNDFKVPAKKERPQLELFKLRH